MRRALGRCRSRAGTPKARPVRGQQRRVRTEGGVRPLISSHPAPLRSSSLALPPLKSRCQGSCEGSAGRGGARAGRAGFPRPRAGPPAAPAGLQHVPCPPRAHPAPPRCQRREPKAPPEAVPKSAGTRGPFAFHLSRTERFVSGRQGGRDVPEQGAACAGLAREPGRERAGKEPGRSRVSPGAAVTQLQGTLRPHGTQGRLPDPPRAAERSLRAAPAALINE